MIIRTTDNIIQVIFRDGDSTGRPSFTEEKEQHGYGGQVMEKLNVAIADDNEKMLDLLENLINEDKELELVGHANNGADIYDII